MDTLLPGISAERVPASRLTVNVLSVPERHDYADDLDQPERFPAELGAYLSGA
jgi:hypothetical protein